MDARRSPDFVIIARTDARAVVGFEEAIKRADAALAVGSDIAFVEAPPTVDEVKAVPGLVAGPCLLNVVHRGKTPPIELNTAEAMSYMLAILPTLLFRGVIGCCEELLSELKTGVFLAPPKDLSPHEAFARFGADEWDSLRQCLREGRKTVADLRSPRWGEAPDGCSLLRAQLGIELVFEPNRQTS